MSENANSLFELADKFIALANELTAAEGDVGKVGTALRFAAARFNAFEAAIKSADLENEKANALKWFSDDYQDMLNDNLDDHIANPPVATAPEAEPAVDNAVQTFKL